MTALGHHHLHDGRRGENHYCARCLCTRTFHEHPDGATLSCEHCRKELQRRRSTL